MAFRRYLIYLKGEVEAVIYLVVSVFLGPMTKIITLLPNGQVDISAGFPCLIYFLLYTFILE